jgi:hypothetical protein
MILFFFSGESKNFMNNLSTRNYGFTLIPTLNYEFSCCLYKQYDVEYIQFMNEVVLTHHRKWINIFSVQV